MPAEHLGPLAIPATRRPRACDHPFHVALRERTAPDARWTVVNERVPGLDQRAQSFLPASSRADDATWSHYLHQESLGSVGWKDMGTVGGTGGRIWVLAFPPVGSPPSPPSPFPQRLLKALSATSIALETTSTAYCLNPCQLSLQPPDCHGGPAGILFCFCGLGRFWNFSRLPLSSSGIGFWGTDFAPWLCRVVHGSRWREILR